MNRLLTILMASGAALAVLDASVAAMPLGADRAEGPGTGLLRPVQLGNAGPANGIGRGTGAFGGPTPGSAAGAVGGGPPGIGTAGGLRPNISGGKPNGSKPAPMRANGVRKVQ